MMKGWDGVYLDTLMPCVIENYGHATATVLSLLELPDVFTKSVLLRLPVTLLHTSAETTTRWSTAISTFLSVNSGTSRWSLELRANR